MKKVYEVDLTKLEVGNLVIFHPRDGFLIILQKKTKNRIKVLHDDGNTNSYFSNNSTFLLSKTSIDAGLCYWII